MKKKCTYILVILVTLTLTAVTAASAFASGSADKTNPYETVDGVLAVKEGHGEFLVRLSDGSAQRFMVRGNAADITRNGKPARYSELKVSDSIQVKYKASNRKVVEISATGS